MITYNHENFIEEAINSVLMQECNFEIELIIVNDCSPDKTDDVIKIILENNTKASKIKYFKQQKNVGVMSNFAFALKKCSGKYIAICEGDDYWTDPLKLTKQFNFLENNPKYIIHSSNAIQLSDNFDLNYKPVLKDITDKTFILDDFLIANNIITCTVMFRNDKIEFPSDFYKVTFGDWMLYVILLFTSNKKAYRTTECLSVYRIHNGGVMSNLNDLKYFKSHINQILIIKKYLNIKRFSNSAIEILNQYSLESFRIEINKRMYKEALRTLFGNLYCSKFKIPFKKYAQSVKNYYL
ncbi:glycosyltransferase family 2 protein [Flavobacterium ginsengiterrae]